MSTLDEWKNQWEHSFKEPASYDEGSLNKIIKSRVSKHTRATMQYFWASFALQVLVYALLSHVMIKYWNETQALALSLLGILIFLPFTVVLMKKFKRFSLAEVKGKGVSSIHEYIFQQRALLESFFNFKKRYEMVLVPLSSAIGVILVFTLYVPGGVPAFPVGAFITYLLTLLSCYLAIRSENKKSFAQPLAQLNALLKEYKG